MNHVRFHSWCPPEAAFEAGDEVGMYLQAELPMWIKDVGKYPDRRDFFEKEMYAILDAYGNHPSFILMCNGNENEGDFAVLEDLVKKAQKYDNQRLYSASTARTPLLRISTMCRMSPRKDGLPYTRESHRLTGTVAKNRISMYR